jgi:hypothetical protein
MSSNREQFKVAVLDDYQDVALRMADWSVLKGRADVTVFNDHIADVDAVVSRLQSFDVVCVMRERTPMTRAVIERLPKLRLIASTALRNASIDVAAAEERGVQVVHTGYTSVPTIELTWALILAGARHLIDENASLRGGGWQRHTVCARGWPRSGVDTSMLMSSNFRARAPRADDGPEFQTLVKRIAELGFGQASFTKRSVTLDVSEYFVVMVDDLAGRQRITSEKFMSTILSEGLFEAYLELRAQMNDAARRNRMAGKLRLSVSGNESVRIVSSCCCCLV